MIKFTYYKATATRYGKLPHFLYGKSNDGATYGNDGATQLNLDVP